MYKTFAGKYKSSVREIINKYYRDGEFRIPYETKDGEKQCLFYN